MDTNKIIDRVLIKSHKEKIKEHTDDLIKLGLSKEDIVTFITDYLYEKENNK